MANIILEKMGQAPSNSSSNNTTVSSMGSHRRRSFRSPFVRRKKPKHILSATFQAPISNDFETLNINTATVEQFMTLPGINRRIAQSIVEHRSAIGGRFQRVDDLALVSGIGAEKLEQIRPEICVKRLAQRSNQGSSVSSRTPSLDSILSEPNISMQQRSLINVNTSSVFQLQQINGMNQEIAANLVDYRARKGNFKSLDDLIKVKGLSMVRLSTIRPSLCLNGNDFIQKQHKIQTISLSNCPSSTPTKLNGITPNVGHRKSMSMPIKMNLGLTNGFENAPVNDIFDLLGAYSHRPILEDNYNNTRNGHRSLRIATWNLDQFSMEKCANLGVREVICRTILEQKFSIICIQECIESMTLQQICDELNNSTLRRICEWKDNNHKWKWLTNSTCIDGNLNGLGFIYDSYVCDVIRNECFDIPLDNCVADDKNCPVTPTAYLASFKMLDWTCRILNTYLRYYNLKNVDKVIKTVESFLNDDDADTLTINDIYFVVGDFSESTIEMESSLTKFNPKMYKKCTKQLSSINFETLGFTAIADGQSTAFNFVDQLQQQQQDDQKHLKLKTLQNHRLINNSSSCNILCRDKMPSIRSAFRDAIYTTKSALTIYQKDFIDVPSSVANENVDDQRLCGYWGIVRQGLCHMAIPKDWSWGGPVSKHCPIWIEIYCRRDRCNEQLSIENSIDNNCDNNDEECVIIDDNDDGNNSSSVSYRQLTNGHHDDSSTNGNLNESSDSVFLSSNKMTR